MATHPILFSSFLAAIAAAALMGWMLLTAGARIDSAEARGGITTEATLARTGAKEIPSEPKLSVEPAGYR
jgi:hypothetical protein